MTMPRARRRDLVRDAVVGSEASAVAAGIFDVQGDAQ